MKLKQIGILEAEKLTRWVQLGTVYQDGGPILAIMAEKKGWSKHYDSRGQKRAANKLQRKCSAQ